MSWNIRPATAEEAVTFGVGERLGGIPFQLLVAEQPSGIFATQLAMVSSGKVGDLLPVISSGPLPEEVTVKLCREQLWYLSRQDVSLIQTILPEERNAEVATYERAGLRCVTRLSQYVLKLPVEVAPAHLTARRCELDDPKLATILLDTYAGSFDLPELNDLRQGSDILLSLQMEGWENFWHLLSEDVGIVLLRVSPETEEAKLDYLGLVPHARGKKLGRRILQWSLHEATRKGATRVSLSVDVRNLVAIHLYESVGFELERTYRYLFHSRPTI